MPTATLTRIKNMLSIGLDSQIKMGPNTAIAVEVSHTAVQMARFLIERFTVVFIVKEFIV
jgi:hypothetical protein